MFLQAHKITLKIKFYWFNYCPIRIPTLGNSQVAIVTIMLGITDVVSHLLYVGVWVWVCVWVCGCVRVWVGVYVRRWCGHVRTVIS